MRRLAYVIGLVCLVRPVRAESSVTPPAAEVTVRIQRTEPSVVVYVEQMGPYWTVRARLSEVVAYRRSHGLTGAVYVRYGSSPTGRHAGAIRSEIGFVAHSTFKPDPPFQQANRDAEWVASMPMERSGAIAPRHYRKLLHWVKANGYRPLGPMIEWYPNGFGKSAEGRMNDLVSLRVPIEPPVSWPVSEQAIRNDQESVEETANTAVAPTSSVPFSSTVSASANRERVASSGPPPVPHASEKAQTVDTTLDTIENRDDVATKPHDVQPIPPSHTKPLSVSFVDNGTASMAALLEAGHVEAIVQRLMPTDQAIAPDLDLWLGQIVFRVSAAGKGLARTYPEDKGHVSSLAKAIKERYRKASTEQSGRVLSQVIVRVPRGGSRSATQRQSVLRDMDRLLSRIAMKAVDANRARTDLAGLLERVKAVISANRSVPPEIKQGEIPKKNM